MAIALHSNTLSDFIDYYHTLLNKPAFLMSAAEKQSHAELIHNLSLDILKMKTEGLTTLNELIKGQHENIRQATENLSSAANDSTYSVLVESVSRNIDMLDGLIIFAQ